METFETEISSNTDVKSTTSFLSPTDPLYHETIAAAAEQKTMPVEVITWAQSLFAEVQKGEALFLEKSQRACLGAVLLLAKLFTPPRGSGRKADILAEILGIDGDLIERALSIIKKNRAAGLRIAAGEWTVEMAERRERANDPTFRRNSRKRPGTRTNRGDAVEEMEALDQKISGLQADWERLLDMLTAARKLEDGAMFRAAIDQALKFGFSRSALDHAEASAQEPPNEANLGGIAMPSASDFAMEEVNVDPDVARSTKEAA